VNPDPDQGRMCAMVISRETYVREGGGNVGWQIFGHGAALPTEPVCNAGPGFFSLPLTVRTGTKLLRADDVKTYRTFAPPAA